MIIEVSSTFKECSVLKGASCAFGVFDGVHRGHRFIIGRALEAARSRKAPCAIITFQKDPDELFCPDRLKKLMSNERRLALLDECGASYVLALPFCADFFSLSADEFMQNVFGQNVPASLHVGCDFRFGKCAQGTVESLEAWGAQAGMAVDACDLFSCGGKPVTASSIRQLLAEREIGRANELLGSRFALEGIVESGRREGRTMGFCTANVSIPANLYSLGEGVYGAYAYTEAGDCYKAAVSVGGAPTFGEASHANIEAHLLDFDQDIYGQILRLELVAFLRPMIVFESIDDLIQTVKGNIQWCRDNL